MEGGAYVDIRVSVLDIDNGRAVGVIEDILHPNELERVKVKAHEVAAVIGEEGIVIDDRSRGLYAEPIL